MPHTMFKCFRYKFLEVSPVSVASVAYIKAICEIVRYISLLSLSK